MLCMQTGQNMNLFIGCCVFYGLDGISIKEIVRTSEFRKRRFKKIFPWFSFLVMVRYVILLHKSNWLIYILQPVVSDTQCFFFHDSTKEMHWKLSQDQGNFYMQLRVDFLKTVITLFLQVKIFWSFCSMEEICHHLFHSCFDDHTPTFENLIS